MPVELGVDWLDSPQRFSFIAFRQYLQRYGFDSSAIRYRATASLSHPAGEVSAAWLKVINGEPQLTVDVSLMGLYGTTSPLPAFYTERILGLDGDDSVENGVTLVDGQYESGRDLKQFYDLFNHRAISLFYDAWNKYRIACRFSYSSSYEEGECNESYQQTTDEFSTALLSIWGIDNERLASFKHLTLPRLMPLAGLLATRCSSIDLLEQALNQFFGDVMITTQSLVSGFVDVPHDQLNSLGQNNASLSESLVLGQEVADCSSILVSIRLSSSDQLNHWLPGGKQNETARELISILLDAPNDYQMTLNVSDTFKGLSEIGHSTIDGKTADSTASDRSNFYRSNIDRPNSAHRGLGLGVGLGETRNAVINI